MTGTKNRAYEGDEGGSSERIDGGSEISSVSKKIFPHGVHGPDISKFVSNLKFLKSYEVLFFQFNFNEFATRKTIAQGKYEFFIDLLKAY